MDGTRKKKEVKKMKNEQRERLIELMTGAENEELSLLEFEKKILADYLLNKGVVVLPCRCNKCSNRCESTNECTLYGRICTENGYCDKAEKALERRKAE